MAGLWVSVEAKEMDIQRQTFQKLIIFTLFSNSRFLVHFCIEIW